MVRFQDEPPEPYKSMYKFLAWGTHVHRIHLSDDGKSLLCKRPWGKSNYFQGRPGRPGWYLKTPVFYPNKTYMICQECNTEHHRRRLDEG